MEAGDLAAQIAKLEADVMARNVLHDPADPLSHTLFIIRLEMGRPEPDIRYIRGLLRSALAKQLIEA